MTVRTICYIPRSPEHEPGRDSCSRWHRKLIKSHGHLAVLRTFRPALLHQALFAAAVLGFTVRTGTMQISNGDPLSVIRGVIQ